MAWRLRGSLVPLGVLLASLFAADSLDLRPRAPSGHPLSPPKHLRHDAVVIAFTTIPDRMMTEMPRMVQSLRRQSGVTRPVHFYLALPRTFKNKTVHADLARLSEAVDARAGDPAVEIEWVEDRGPTTRIVYAGRKYGSRHAVLNVDDDEVYKPGTLKEFFETYARETEKHPRIIITKSIIQLIPGSYCMAHRENADLTKVFESFAGVLYPPGFFSDDLVSWMQALPDFCQKADDYILSVWAQRHGYDVRGAAPSDASALSLLQAPHLSEDRVSGDPTCQDVGCPHGGFCSANTIRYERCRRYLAKHPL